MRLGWTSITTICMTASFWILSATAQNIPTFNATKFSELPTCVINCGARILPEYNCTVAEPCFCAQTGPLSRAIYDCVIDDCTLDQALDSFQFQADTCDWRVFGTRSASRPASWSMFAIGALLVLARCTSRLRVFNGAGFGWDDFVAVCCFIVSIGMMVVTEAEVVLGIGKSLWTVPRGNLDPITMWFYIALPFYVFVTFMTKFSLVLLYLRIWREERRTPFRITCWVVAISLLLCTIGCILVVTAFPCRPLHIVWHADPKALRDKCLDPAVPAYAFSAFNITYDIIVILLPMPRFIGLHLSLAKRIALCSCVLIGLATTVISIIRLTHISAYHRLQNFTSDWYQADLWSVTEVHVSIICCCVPVLPGIVHRSTKAVKHLMTKTSNSINSSVSKSRGLFSPVLCNPRPRSPDNSMTKTCSTDSPSPKVDQGTNDSTEQIVRRAAVNGARLKATLRRIEKAHVDENDVERGHVATEEKEKSEEGEDV